MKWLSFTVGALLLTASVALSADNNVIGPASQQPAPAFKALAQVPAPTSLTDEQLSQIQGALANFNALPPNNPGTANAVTKIPAAVFTTHVRDQWFGKASGH